MTTTHLPDELAGRRDFDYITPAGRRLTEYEAVTCYTQPSPTGGGLQTCGDFVLRPDHRPLYDPASTRLALDDWYAFRDPNQTWQRPYYAEQAKAERAIDLATEMSITTGGAADMDPGWLDRGLAAGYLTFAHVEYGLARTLNVAAREALSDTVTTGFVFDATDKLRHAQAIALYGFDLAGAVDGFEAAAGPRAWLEDELWQPVRRLIEEAMALTDWGEMIIAANLAVEPLLAEPLRRIHFGSLAGRRGDRVTPVITSGASRDWLRNRALTHAFVRFAGQAEANRSVLAEWFEAWTARTEPVATGFLSGFSAALDAPEAAEAAMTVGQDERAAVASDLLAMGGR